MITLDGSKQWDKFDFHYQAIDGNDETTLPFKLLVLGDFSLSDDNRMIHLLKPQRVDALSFNRVLKSQNIRGDIEITLASDDGNLEYLDIEFSINGMDCFEPASLVQQVPYLKRHQLLMAKLSQLSSDESISSQLDRDELKLLTQCDIDIAALNTAELPFVLCDINEHLYEILDVILHHEAFQKLESIWRNLHQLVMCSDEVEHCIIEFLDISQHQIQEDFDANRDVRDSVLFDVVYLQEFAQYGGQPYTAMVADYEFSAGAQDIALLRAIAQVANAAHAPFIGGVSPKFFASTDFSNLANVGDIEELITSPKYIKWRALQQDPIASYIGLALPKIQLRNGYNFAAGALGPMPYEEDTRLTSDKVLLGNASFAYGRCLINSFARYSVCTDICGVQGGRVLPSCDNQADVKFPNFPIETVISEQKIAQLGQIGFLPLSINKRINELIFNVAGSLRWGSLTIPMSRSTDELLHAQVEAQLPYLFVISCIAHYLKVVERDNVGSLKNVSELQGELNKWLRRYVSDVENPAPGVRARKPLKKAEVVLKKNEDESRHQLTVTVVPHMKYLGSDFVLALDVLAQ